MAELTTEYVFNGSLEDVFTGLKRYDLYAKYLPGVTATTVLPAKVNGSGCQVRYDLKLIKTFHYTLNMFDDTKNKIWWSLSDSNIMKSSSGSWELSPIDKHHTKAVYKLDIAFSGLVPQKIVDQLTKANLPLMMDGFQKLIAAK
jgi:ribosome-associated toxin RatA of RatAB toxin-antitoxin module